MDVIHATIAAVSGIRPIADHATAEQDTEVLVQMRQQGAIVHVSFPTPPQFPQFQEGNILLIRARPIRRHIQHQRRRAAIIEEVLRQARAAAAAVGRVEHAVEVRQQVDGRAVVHALGEDAGDADADVRLGVVADDGRVDDERDERLLRGGVVFLEEGRGVVVADGDVGGALCEAGGAQEGEDADGGELEHCEGRLGLGSWVCFVKLLS